jgi:hypothetical protein
VIDVEVSEWYELESQHVFQVQVPARVHHVPAFRPRALRLTETPTAANGAVALVKPTSNARLDWRSQVFARRRGHRMSLPHGKVGIADLFTEVHAQTHAAQSPASVRRYAVGSKAGLRLDSRLVNGGRGPSVDQQVYFRFCTRGKRCGVGFEIDVDAMRFELKLPDHPHREIDLNHGPTRRGLRSARYFWEARNGPNLTAVEPNVFLREWIAEIFMLAALERCIKQAEDLPTAVDRLAANHEPIAVDHILETLLQAPRLDTAGNEESEDEIDGEDTAARDPFKLRRRLRACLSRPEIRSSLSELARHFVEPIDESWDPWLHRVMKHTHAAAVLDAIQTSCPQVDVEELAVDVDPGPTEDGQPDTAPVIWISEINPGGNGLVEQVADILATDSAGFFRQVESALGLSEFEVIDQQLSELVDRLASSTPDADLIRLVHAVRDSGTTLEAQAAIASLRHALVMRGHSVFHGYVSAMANRLLRPGTPAVLDTVVAQSLDTWRRLEAQFGIEVDAQLVCALGSLDTRLDTAFAAIADALPEPAQRPAWRFGILRGILWPRGHALRATALPLYLRYERTTSATERLALRRWLTKPRTPVDATAPGWIEQVHEQLKTLGQTGVAIPHNRQRLSQLIEALTTQPVQMEYLNVYPRLRSVTRSPDLIELHLELAETLG